MLVISINNDWVNKNCSNEQLFKCETYKYFNNEIFISFTFNLFVTKYSTGKNKVFQKSQFLGKKKQCTFFFLFNFLCITYFNIAINNVVIYQRNFVPFFLGQISLSNICNFWFSSGRRCILIHFLLLLTV